MVLVWAAVLGAVGFVCGFLGPMVLAPDANQGPMAGIFITGPGGFVLGLALGSAVRLGGWSAQASKRALAGCAAVLALATLYFCIPAPRRVADLVAGEVRACVPADARRSATAERLAAYEAGHVCLRRFK